MGTRGSPLARTQALWVRDALVAARPGLEIEVVEIRTLAEKFPEKAAAELGVGIFTREIDAALLEGAIDFAVHSLKDVPTELPAGIALAAVPARESPLDAFISRDGTPFDALPPGSAIGTGSLRRKAQILQRRPDLRVVPIRGNVATRVRKMEELGLAGIVLAHAGLLRLGEEARIAHVFSPEEMLPAPGQGLLAVTARAGDAETLEALRPIDHRPSRLQGEAERAFLRRLRGGCLVPAGALARGPEGGPGGEVLLLEGAIAAPDGSACFRGELARDADDPRGLGERLADELLERGGSRIVAALGRGLGGRRVAIARSEEEASALAARLAALGAEAVALPLLRHVLRDEPAALARAAEGAEAYSFLIFASPAAVRLFALACERRGISPAAWSRARAAAVGPGTAAELERIGLSPAIVGEGGGEALARKILAAAGDPREIRALLPQSSRARPELRRALEEAGARVDAFSLYDTVPEERQAARPLLERAFGAGPPDAVVFASPSAFEAFLELASERELGALRSGASKIVSVGPTTSAAIRARGYAVAAEAERPGDEGLLAAVLGALG